MKIDLHCHSSYSSRPSDWFLKKIGASESYTKPEDLYHIQKENGMDFVTITDHNTIDGCLELMKQHDDTFISCEYTTYLPADKCKFHVLCWNITEKQHASIMSIREDIYALVEFLKDNKISHGLAHPLFSVNGRLNVENFREVIELFNVFEMNAAKDAFSNEYLELILSKAKKSYSLSSGSDDHSGLTLSRGHTIVDGAWTLDEFFSSLNSGNNTIQCEGSTPHTLARHIYSIALQWLHHTGRTGFYPNVVQTYLLPKTLMTSKVSNLVDKLKNSHPKYWGKNAVFKYLSSKLSELDQFNFVDQPPSERFFHLIEQATNKYLVDLGGTVVNAVISGKMFDIFRNVGISLFLYVLLAPYFIGFSIFGAQRKLSRQILRYYVPNNIVPMRIAKFTDNFGKIDGVSKTLEEQAVEAHRSGKDYTIITCMGDDQWSNFPNVQYFEPIGMFSAPEYSEQPLCWPPVLKIMDYCYSEQFTHIQTATPGPMGLLAMAVAHILGLPLHATYHTQIPQFIGEVTEEGFIEGIAWKYILWFYSQADVVFAPSEHTKEDLVSHGFDRSKIRVYPRGVDTERFHPSKRDRGWLKSTYGIDCDSKVFLFVGRVSKEKNIKLTVEAYRNFCEITPNNSVLMIVGHGDYEQELKALSQNLPVIFTGSVVGEDLAKIFASADVFVFSSTRDTHGRVILEAAASGLPCIVSNEGGPKENVVDMETGIVVKNVNLERLTDAMVIMYLTNLDEMSKSSRQFAEGKSFSKAFEDYWNMYE